MPHKHELPDGTMSGVDEAVGNELHDHAVPGSNVRTLVAREGEGHVHVVVGSITGPPVPTKRKKSDD